LLGILLSGGGAFIKKIEKWRYIILIITAPLGESQVVNVPGNSGTS